MFLSQWRQQRREKRALAFGRAFLAAAWGVAPETLSDDDVYNGMHAGILAFQAARYAAFPTFEQAARALEVFALTAYQLWEQEQSHANTGS